MLHHARCHRCPLSAVPAGSTGCRAHGEGGSRDWRLVPWQLHTGRARQHQRWVRTGPLLPLYWDDSPTWLSM